MLNQMPMYAFCFLPAVAMRGQASHRAEMVNQLLFGDQVELLDHQAEWLRVRSLYDGYEGWVDDKQLVEVLALMAADYCAATPCRVVVPAATGWMAADYALTIPTGACCPAAWLAEPPRKVTETPLEVASRFLGAPYLWGGRTAMGIDCSGLVQVAHKVCGIALPRDASQQVSVGKEVAYDERHAGDLAFFVDGGSIVHVGICTADGNILHASGRVRCDRLTADGIWDASRGVLTHRLHSVRRLG